MDGRDPAASGGNVRPLNRILQVSIRRSTGAVFAPQDSTEREPTLASSISELVVLGMTLVVAVAASMVVVALLRGRRNSSRPA
jgi:hypothetical protein